MSTKSASKPSISASSLPTCATSNEWVSLVLAKSPLSGDKTWVFALRRLSAELCRILALSLANSDLFDLGVD